MNAKEIFTDGGCSGNPGPGGWAFVILDSNTVLTSQSGGEQLTTNNKMELNAVINALQTSKTLGFDSVVINTDSQYVKNGITTWIHNWKKNGWRTAGKDPVKNKDLWVTLDALVKEVNVSWRWVKGHAGIEYNELCDTMVRSEMDKFK